MNLQTLEKTSQAIKKIEDGIVTLTGSLSYPYITGNWSKGMFKDVQQEGHRSQQIKHVLVGRGPDKVTPKDSQDGIFRSPG
jgi:hypothetical protein